jgi:hypothetical protein
MGIDVKTLLGGVASATFAYARSLCVPGLSRSSINGWAEPGVTDCSRSVGSCTRGANFLVSMEACGLFWISTIPFQKRATGTSLSSTSLPLP